MAQEAINLIKKAEEDAKNIIINSELEAQRLISEAENEKKSFIQQLENELDEKYAHAVEEARSQAAQNSEINLKEAEDEAQNLAKQLKEKTGGAVGRVLDSLAL